MRRIAAVAANRICALVWLLLLGVCLPVIAQDSNALEPPTLLTNLFQLRSCAEQKPFVSHPFRIVAEVLDSDFASGVLVLRDASGVEFVQLEVGDQKFGPGTTICLAGTGCGVTPKSFGLAIVPGIVVDNDGLHGMRLASGTTFLHAGLNPITVQWFNGSGAFGLNVEYRGPGLPRRSIPSSVLSRAIIVPATGITNFSPGLDYRAYEGEGTWVKLPDFAALHPVSAGIATNFDLNARTRNEKVALEFNGFISIPRDGAYTFYLTSDDGSRLFVGGPSLEISVLSHGPAPRVAENVPATSLERNSRPWVSLEGTVKFAGVRGAGGEMLMRVGNDDIRVRILAGGETVSNVLTDAKVGISGIYQDVVSEDGSRVPGMLLVSSWEKVRPVPASDKNFATVIPNEEAPKPSVAGTRPAAAATPMITTASGVKALTIEMAKQRLAVVIRGVVTAVLPDYLRGAVVQDSTKGIFVSLQNISDPKALQLGEFYEIEGVTGPGSFAPVVVARHITHLGAGFLPQPLLATWDQLKNGSLDTQYAEVNGVVTKVHDQKIEMLTEGGMVTLVLDDLQPEDLAGCENALVQIRGCAFAFFNLQTRELDASSLRILGGAIDILQPAPHDLFDAPEKSLEALLLFDPKAAPFRRLKVAGQVIYGRAGQYFLTDGTNGLRVTTRDSKLLAVGDLAEAVGFLDLEGPVAELKEAVVRKTGRASLPAPTKLTPDQLLLSRYAGTLVQVSATLVNQWREGSETMLNLQSGFLAFRALIDNHGQSVSLPPSGSRLELTGVYEPGGKGPSDGGVNGFDLLLASPTGVRVLATPPWWTLKRVLVLAGTLAALLCAVLIWNKELQRKVLERGRQLETEIDNRQQAELQRAAEAERSRISRDLHDELGSGLTEVSLLANAALGEFEAKEKNKDRFRVIADKARALVSNLDVIVWAIDPKRSSLQSFADYLGRYATELFSSSGIVCRFKIPIECKAVALTEAARHNLFLAVKEALNNIIRHASATEVKLQMTQADDGLEIVIADNGRGFDLNTIRRGNGLTNLQERLKAIKGQCHIESLAGKGTTVKFSVPLPNTRFNSHI